MTHAFRHGAFGMTPSESSDAIDSMFQGLLRPDLDHPRAPRIRVDVVEDALCYVVRADLPGVTEDAIEVDVDGNVLSLSAVVPRATAARSGVTELRRERHRGHVGRRLAFEVALDAAGLTRRYDNGVLELRLPKKTGTDGEPRAVQ